MPQGRDGGASASAEDKVRRVAMLEVNSCRIGALFRDTADTNMLCYLFFLQGHGRHSIEDSVRTLVDQCEETRGGLPQELEHFKKYGFFTVEMFPFWYIALVEQLVKDTKESREWVDLFKRQSSVHDNRWDNQRKMNTVIEGDILHRLITTPLAAMMRGLGLLDVVDAEEKRVVDVCGVLESRPAPTPKSGKKNTTAGLQGMHADMDAWFKWLQRFGFSLITAGRRAAQVDIYVGSWDGGRGPFEEPMSVNLPPGCTIVFHGLARHRGVSYPDYLNYRFFVSFVVRSVLDEAERRRVAETTALEKHKFQEPQALSREAWVKKWGEFYINRLR